MTVLIGAEVSNGSFGFVNRNKPCALATEKLCAIDMGVGGCKE